MPATGSIASARGGVKQRASSVIAVSVLAILEACALLVFALNWTRVGSEMSAGGVLVLPLLGLLVYFRASLLVATAALYLLFAWGALTARRWAWTVGLAAVVLDGLLVLMLLGSPVALLLRAVVPLIVLYFLVSTGGRRALGR
jgi:hypothetical protein